MARMHRDDSLRPTLWRTCRVLANATRLKILRLLIQEGRLTVTGVAKRLKLAMAVASQYLRALEARSLLRVHRDRRWVEYEAGNLPKNTPPHELVGSLRTTFSGNDGEALQAVFRLATAFTHPRRVDIYRALNQRPRSLGELKLATGISARALLRHLDKLTQRGFVRQNRKWRGKYQVIQHRDPIGRALAGMAAQNR